MNRRLPVPWWQRPQYWRPVSSPTRGSPLMPAVAMWRIREIMGSLDRLRWIQPGDSEPAEYGPKD